MEEQKEIEDAVQKEEGKEEVKEEKPSFLDEVRKEKEDLINIRDELRELRANQILSGKAEGITEKEHPKEETPQEYKDRVMRNEL